MSRLSRLVLVDSDSRSANTLTYAFERDGIVVSKAANVRGVLEVVKAQQGELVLSGVKPEGGPLDELLTQVAKHAGVPLVVLGETEKRSSALLLGASEFLAIPSFVRDVVNVCRLACMPREGVPGVSVGDVGDFQGVFYLVRAVSAAQRSAVLTLIRGLRRGEVRFYEGEVTSAQVGGLHGLAALHQLLLWTDARFELRRETVVRRQQIPMPLEELFENARRFLREFRDAAKDISPGTIYEQDLRRVAECVGKIPKEVNPVLRLFDGARTLADVVEDSPFRVVETVKITARLAKMNALRPIVGPRQRSGSSAALAIEDWLVGNATPQAGVPIPAPARESERIGPPPGEPASPPSDGAYAAVRDAANETRKNKKKAKKGQKRDGAEAVPERSEMSDVSQESTEPTFVPPASFASQLLPAPTLPKTYAPVVPSQGVKGEFLTAPSAMATGEIVSSRGAVSGEIALPKKTAVSGEVVVKQPAAPVPFRRAPSAPVVVPPSPEPGLGSPAVILAPEPALSAPLVVIAPRRAPSSPAVEAVLSTALRERLEDVLSNQQRQALFADGPRERAEREEPEAPEEIVGQRPREASRHVVHEPMVESSLVSAVARHPAPVEAIAQVPLREVAPAPRAVAAPRHKTPTGPLPAMSAPPPRARRATGDVAKSVARQSGSFNAIEEEFFREEHKFAEAVPIPQESFDDLDEGRPAPAGFWQRLFGKREATPPPKAAESRKHKASTHAAPARSHAGRTAIAPSAPGPKKLPSPGGHGQKKKK